VGTGRKIETERERETEGGGHRPTHVAFMRSRAIHEYRLLSVCRARRGAARAIPHIFVFPICK